jgi:SAM-dependent methyltransferase
MRLDFDRYSGDYEQVVQRSIAFSGLEHDFFLQAKADLLATLFTERLARTPPRIVDVGCGVGRLHPFLRPLVASVSGCDPAASAIARAAQDNCWAHYRVSNGDAIPWPDGAFDTALAVCVFHHVPPVAWASLLNEMARVTRFGGLVVIIEHNPWNPATRLAVSRCEFDRDAVLINAAEARRLLRAAPLSGVESRHFLLLPIAAFWARQIESTLSATPAGAQYAAFGTRI